MYPPDESKKRFRNSSSPPVFIVRKSRRSRSVILSALTAIALFYVLFSHSDKTTFAFQNSSSSSTNQVTLPPANSTLGFGAVIAVSPPNSKRRHGLLQAANVTEINITIPELPAWTEADVEQFRSQQAPTEMTASMVTAWMSHIRVLEWFLSTGMETAIILEDDMDWDMRTRSVQVPRAAAALRAMFNSTPSAPHAYYPHSSHWDIIYLGHFDRWAWFGEESGVGMHTPADVKGAPLFADDTLPLRYNMHPKVASILTALDIPPFTRVIHPSRAAFGTWAYAVHRESVAKILSDEVASAAAPKWVIDGFDSSIVRACGGGILKCWTVFPELFHHREGLTTSMIEYPGDHPLIANKAVMNIRNRTGETDGIGCGFASGLLDFKGDANRLEELREGARKGICMKNRVL